MQLLDAWYDLLQRTMRMVVLGTGEAEVVAGFRALAAKDRSIRRAALRALSYRLPGRPALRFLYAYLLRLGFLDGKEGWMFCCAMASYERMIDAALRRPAESTGP